MHSHFILKWWSYNRDTDCQDIQYLWTPNEYWWRACCQQFHCSSNSVIFIILKTSILLFSTCFTHYFSCFSTLTANKISKASLPKEAHPWMEWDELILFLIWLQQFPYAWPFMQWWILDCSSSWNTNSEFLLRVWHGMQEFIYLHRRVPYNFLNYSSWC